MKEAKLHQLIMMQQYQEKHIILYHRSIVDVDANVHVDIRAVVTKNELTTINSQKKPKLLGKRTLVLCDDNNKSVEVILWEAGVVGLMNKNYKTIKLLQQKEQEF